MFFLNPVFENILLINESMIQNNAQELLSYNSTSILRQLAPSVSDEWHKWWLEALIYDYLAQSEKNLVIINQDALQFDLFLQSLIKEREFLPAEIFSKKKKSIENLTMKLSNTKNRNSSITFGLADL
jgi:hypothetical protein